MADLGENPSLRTVHDFIVSRHATRSYEIHVHRTPITERICDVYVFGAGEEIWT